MTAGVDQRRPAPAHPLLTGTEEREAGLVSGLNITMFQIGAAVGTAVVSTVAVSRTSDVIAQTGPVSSALALNEGIQAGFFAL